MLKSIRDVPFCTIKKILYIRDSHYDYSIDEDGYGFAIIANEKILFTVNHYGEINVNSIRYENDSKNQNTTRNISKDY